jgi:hypothetical protein
MFASQRRVYWAAKSSGRAIVETVEIALDRLQSVSSAGDQRVGVGGA